MIELIQFLITNLLHQEAMRLYQMPQYGVHLMTDFEDTKRSGRTPVQHACRITSWSIDQCRRELGWKDHRGE